MRDHAWRSNGGRGWRPGHGDACGLCQGSPDTHPNIPIRDRSASARREMARRRAEFLADGFWAKVDKSGGPDACWPWTGARQHKEARYPTRGGYGLFLVAGRQRYAHRHVLEVTLGRPIRPGFIAMHSCDNPPCCNPAHLREGTKTENHADMVAKGRSHPGGRRLVAA